MHRNMYGETIGSSIRVFKLESKTGKINQGVSLEKEEHLKEGRGRIKQRGGGAPQEQEPKQEGGDCASGG